MDNNYLIAVTKMKSTLNECRDLIDRIQHIDNFEDNIAYNIFDNLFIDIESAIETIEYFSLPTYEGYLIEQPNKRFNINGDEITCGYPLELYCKEDEEWYSGKIQHNGVYYFHNESLKNPPLKNFMKVRIRIKNE